MEFQGFKSPNEFEKVQRSKKETLGPWFDPFHQMKVAQGNHLLKLEPSIYTAALLLPLTYAKRDQSFVSFSTMREYIYVNAPYLLAMVILLVIQITFANSMHNIVRQVSPDDDFGGLESCGGDANPFFKSCALVVLHAYGFGTEVMEALHTLRWIFSFPEYDPERGTEDHSFLTFHEATNSDSESAVVPVFGFRPWIKWGAVAGFVVLRIAVAMWVLIESSGLVLYAPTNLGVIEACVGATFVLDIDNYLYAYLVPGYDKGLIEAMPALGTQDSIGLSHADVKWNEDGPWFLLAALLGLAGAEYGGWCGGPGSAMAAFLSCILPLGCCFVFFCYTSWNEVEADNEYLEYEPLDEKVRRSTLRLCPPWFCS